MAIRLPGGNDCQLRREGMQLASDLMQRLGSRSFGNGRDAVIESMSRVFRNIATGFDKLSCDDLVQFLYFSQGACAELKHQIALAVDNQFLSQEESDDFCHRIRRMSAMLYRFIRNQGVPSSQLSH
jgi:four helix bundle protein